MCFPAAFLAHASPIFFCGGDLNVTVLGIYSTPKQSLLSALGSQIQIAELQLKILIRGGSHQQDTNDKVYPMASEKGD